ncbi:glycosyltransferase family protein [Pontibacter ramchanderi]|uniref:Glycosyltransferase involved in cell wall biosynthesis n=1 Tax=Pontibacter ramchanderi TaxID=1179743 RepID=A0A2N3V1M7_9BACT|nr:glycosyltransferase family 4 protein [Pontibacter ramchanderi]PKV75525.1 hypothetical protein BD749_0467 [Pontibacter ramchanderi]
MEVTGLNIIFFCGSLEPRCDGVGDYIRRLAGELVQQGHSATLISLNDSFVKREIVGKQCVGKIELTVVRIPSVMPNVKKVRCIKNWVEKLHPDWLSLQFVPFAYHSKGLPFTLCFFLMKVGKGRKWHIMFHELWVGMEINSSLKAIVWGTLQQVVIKLLQVNLRPLVYHTQSSLYQLQLAKLGIESKCLPLFSNIPIANNVVIRQENSTLLYNEGKKIFFVLFGGIHPGAPIEEFTEEAALFALENNVQLVLRIVGRCGPEQENWVKTWRAKGLDFELCGEQPAKGVSELLANASIGLTTTPIALVEKSGTVAAMREHGLPVFCIRNTWKARGVKEFSVPAGIYQYQPGNFKDLFMHKGEVDCISTVSSVCKTFIDDISNASCNCKSNHQDI